METKKEEIILGAGDVYILEYTGGSTLDSIPTDSVIEVESNKVGHTQGGASIDYKPTKYDVENSFGKIVKSFITKEELAFKTGLLTWDLKKIALLTTAKITEPTKDKPTRTLTFGASQNGALKNILVRFVHTKGSDKKIRFTMIGNAGNGFSVQFSDKETVVDAEITAIEYIKNFLAKFEEEVDASELPA